MNKEIKVICDYRENSSQVISELKNLSTSDITIDIVMQQLEVGDYQITDDIVIERKTIKDFESSIIDGRLFSQIKNLLNVKKPCIIIEGDINILFRGQGIPKKSLIGLITSLGLNYKIPIFFTKNQKDTAEFLYVIAKREFIKNGNNLIKLRYSKNKLSFCEQQLFIMESFPNVGPTLARTILSEFRTLKNVANSEIKQLMNIPKLGPKKAKSIRQLFDEHFDSDNL